MGITEDQRKQYEEAAKLSNKRRDKIIEILENAKNTNQAVYPLLHFMEADVRKSEREVFTLKSSNELKDKEIDRLKIGVSNLSYQCDRAKRDRDKAEQKADELREALRELVNHNNPYYPKDFIDRCRKLIGDI